MNYLKLNRHLNEYLTLYGDTVEFSSTKDKLKFKLRSWGSPIVSNDYFSALMTLTNQHLYLNKMPSLLTKIHRPYLTHQHTGRVAIDHIIAHYRYIERFPIRVLQQLYGSEPIVLSKLRTEKACYSVCIAPIEQFNKEGELSISILNQEGQRLAICSFTVLLLKGKWTIFIGGLQGGDAHLDHAAIQYATKQCYGLFPKRIVVDCLKLIAQACHIDTLYAVSRHQHIYNHPRYKKRKEAQFIADYDQFWMDIGGVYDEETGLYCLSSQIQRKSLQEISSKKRSQYRKRYRLMDVMAKQLKMSLKNIDFNKIHMNNGYFAQN